MVARVGDFALGEACHGDAVLAARQAASTALAGLAGPPAWALVFAGGQHDPATLVDGLRAVLGDIPLIGGSAPGLITGARASLTGFECGLLLFGADFAPRAIHVVDDLEYDEYAAGERLGQRLRASCDDASTVLLFYDSVHSWPPPRLHVGSRILDGVLTGLSDARPLLIGAGLLGDMQWNRSYLFDGARVAKHIALGVVMPARLTGHVAITHGCFPVSDFMTITGIDGARVLELDGRPALRVAAERLNRPLADLARIHPATLALTLGEKRGNPFAPFDDENYVNRLVVGADGAAEALILTEADFAQGTRVQMMVIEPRRMIDSAREQTARLLARLGDRQPLFALYIDCAGRSMVFNGLEDDESAPVREGIGPRCPLLGFFSGVELAPVRERTRPLDWTGVLAVFTAATG